jgi:hypothetical protein
MRDVHKTLDVSREIMDLLVDLDPGDRLIALGISVTYYGQFICDDHWSQYCDFLRASVQETRDMVAKEKAH